MLALGNLRRSYKKGVFISCLVLAVAASLFIFKHLNYLQSKPEVKAATTSAPPDKSAQYQMPVLVLRYFPTDPLDSTKLDSNITGVDATLADIRNHVDKIQNETLSALGEASKFHGNQDAAAPVSMNYSILDNKEFDTTTPIGIEVPWKPGEGFYRPNYMTILTDQNICNYVDNMGLKEVWLFGWHYGNIEPAESDMAGPNGNYSNSGLASNVFDMPVCSKTYVLYNYNYGRGTDAAVHDHGHQLEAVYNHIDYTTYTGKFEGPWKTYYNNDGSGGNAHRCGWTHDPPNTPATPDMFWGSYDYANTRSVWTDCEDWNPQGTGEAKFYNCDEWQCDEVKFHIWQWQNMPGMNNPNPELSNWWDFIGDFDKAITVGEKLYYPTPTPTPTPRPTTDTDGDGFTDFVESYMGTNANLACGVNAWPPDFNNDGVVDSSDMALIQAHKSTKVGDVNYDKRYDLDATGTIGTTDLQIVFINTGKTCSLPPQTVIGKEIGPDGNNSTQNVDVCGADLGSMFDWNGKVYIVFGDTFGCPLSATPVSWRSNTLAFTTDTNPSDGITFDGWILGADGKAKEIIPNDPGPSTETAIPTYGVSVGSTGYLYYFEGTVSPSWSCNYSSVAKSTDGGQNWTKITGLRWNLGNFNQVAIYKNGGYVYFFGIPCGRAGGTKLMRVLEGSIENKAAYEYVTGYDASQNPIWTVNAESSAVIVVPAPVGELSVRWDNYLGQYIMMYLHDVSPYTIEYRSAPNLWGPWSAPQEVVTGATYPCLYAPYMREGYEEGDGQTVYFRMSRFCSGFNPYSTYWMKTTLIKPSPSPTPTPFPSPTPTPPPIIGDPTLLTATVSCNGSTPVITFRWQDNSNYETGFWLDISRDPFNGPSNTNKSPSVWGVKGIYRSSVDMMERDVPVQFAWDNGTLSLAGGRLDSGDSDSTAGGDQFAPQSGSTYFWRVKAFNFTQATNHIYPGSSASPPGQSVTASSCP